MVQPYITQLLAEERIRDMHAEAARRRLAAAALPAPRPAAPKRAVPVLSLWARFLAFMDRGQLGPGHVACATTTCSS